MFHARSLRRLISLTLACQAHQTVDRLVRTCLFLRCHCLSPCASKPKMFVAALSVACCSRGRHTLCEGPKCSDLYVRTTVFKSNNLSLRKWIPKRIFSRVVAVCVLVAIVVRGLTLRKFRGILLGNLLLVQHTGWHVMRDFTYHQFACTAEYCLVCRPHARRLGAFSHDALPWA